MIRIQKFRSLLFVVSIVVSDLAHAKVEPVSSTTLVIEGSASHPTMALTDEDVLIGRDNYRKFDWARKTGDNLISSASVWLQRDADWIRKHMPGKGACFAYGFAGCPICGKKTGGYWANADCSFDAPGKIKCTNDHVLPSAEYPDAGKGYKAADGRMHYFVGSYNAWAVEMFITGANDLAYAYSLTGDEKYAERCLDILDQLADIYPTCTIGSWDYPETSPGQNSGRFNRPQYQVGRVLITLANAYDQVFESATLNNASVRMGISRRENIEKNMLLDGAWYCYLKSFNFNGLTNGEADYIKGAMVVGIVLGVPEYVRWAVDGPYGIRSMVANNIGRDGTYYETATGYSNYTRSIYLGYAEYLHNYRGSAYPDGVNLFEDKKFCKFLTLLNANTQIGGGIPSYGDAAPTVGAWKADARPFDRFDFVSLEYLRRYANDEEARKANQLIQWLTEGKPELHYLDSWAATWFLFHRKSDQSGEDSGSTLNDSESILHSNVLGQKGLAMLRTHWDQSESNQGVIVRYGPSLNHGNYDDLNFTYHALGEDLTYDLGYALGSAHVFTGWSKHTASHQNVVVNETSLVYPREESGGSLDAFWEGKRTAAMEVSSPGSYKSHGVSDYRRALFLVGAPEGSNHGNYVVDMFYVEGGKSHDSFTHSKGRKVTFGNAVVDEASSGSLAGETIDWGSRVLVDGDVSGVSNKPYWVAPPGNGYGFLMNPQKINPAENAWWADWEQPKTGSHARVWFPVDHSEKSLAAWGPGILKDLPDAGYVVRRRSPSDGKSIFISVWEPYKTQSQIKNVTRLKSTSDGSACIKVSFADGWEDVLFWSKELEAANIDNISFEAKFARVSLQDGKLADFDGLAVKKYPSEFKAGNDQKVASFSGSLEVVDSAAGILTTKVKLPTSEKLRGLWITFNNPGYTRNTAYQIESVASYSTGSLITLTESCELGKGIVSAVDGTSHSIRSVISHEYAKSVNRKIGSGFFSGKTVENVKTRFSTRIVSAGIDQPMTLEVADIRGFSNGDELRYIDIAAGDNFTILMPSSR